jgi:hypothetical protein
LGEELETALKETMKAVGSSELGLLVEEGGLLLAGEGDAVLWSQEMLGTAL